MPMSERFTSFVGRVTNSPQNLPNFIGRKWNNKEEGNGRSKKEGHICHSRTTECLTPQNIICAHTCYCRRYKSVACFFFFSPCLIHLFWERRWMMPRHTLNGWCPETFWMDDAQTHFEWMMLRHILNGWCPDTLWTPCYAHFGLVIGTKAPTHYVHTCPKPPKQDSKCVQIARNTSWMGKRVVMEKNKEACSN